MITIYLDGRLHQKELAKLSEIYLKRLEKLPLFRLKIVYYKDESTLLKIASMDGHTCLLLSEQGREYDTAKFASFLSPVFSEHKSFTFMVGPPDGFSDELKAKVPSLSLSKLTFTHEFAFVLLLEQVYRAYCLYTGKSYHRP